MDKTSSFKLLSLCNNWIRYEVLLESNRMADSWPYVTKWHPNTPQGDHEARQEVGRWIKKNIVN